MRTPDLHTLLRREATALDAAVREHPALGPLVARSAERSAAELRAAYVRYLKVTADYVRHTVPMLRAAGRALADGDDEDRAWSERFLAYADDETDPQGAYGHHHWALADLRALGMGERALAEPAHPAVDAYGDFFVDRAAEHPYAILGAKAVLEHLSIRISDDVVAGVRAAGIAYADDAVTFFEHHGVLDVAHVEAGDRNLAGLGSAAKRAQVFLGGVVTAGCYRAWLHACA